MNYRKYIRFIVAVPACLCALLLPSSCSTEYEDRIVYNDTEQPFEATFHPDTIRVGKLQTGSIRHLLDLNTPSTEIDNKPEYTFRSDELISVHASDDGDSLYITSWSAKTVYKISVEMFLPEVNEYLPVAFLDSIPAFSRFGFRPSFLGNRSVCRVPNSNDFVSFEYQYIDEARRKLRLTGDDEHFRMLSKIDAKWKCYFSNYGWTPESPATHNYREMSPIYAREWVVIVTNYAYMMTTPEYKYIMEHFSEVMGGELIDNEDKPFTMEKYLSEMERFKAPATFKLGRCNNSYAGLGGSGIWTVATWNFYGHYASFSGWDAIGHEFMHCMGYSHNGNMTYPAKPQGSDIDVGWTTFLWQLHLWLSHKGDLPYTDRNMLGFHKPENAKYRDEAIRGDFQDDAKLQQKIQEYYNSSRLVKYFKEHPLE